MKRSILLVLPLLFFIHCSEDTSDRDRAGREGSGMMEDREMGMMREGGMMDAHRWMMMDEEMMRGMGPGMMQDMQTIHQLLVNHEQVERRVVNRPNGIESWTESDDPEIARAIQTHVHQMKERMEEGRAIRHMDPLFRELFRQSETIEMTVENTARGVHVIETSDDPTVVRLIQQHANRAVNEFVEQGMQRAMQPTPLPEGYEP